ncbi:indolepyruvate oxidoreductase subunit beta [bacterium]|nr:indolepyruvate oxidoreductase subunit beta [bacterium]
MEKLSIDPFNLIITGVGGQGNVMASRVIGNMLSQQGYFVTIGETFGASQRGGSVMSHLRISAESSFSPQIAKGQAHMIVALEPTEALRVLGNYGNPRVNVLCNTRPIHSVGVISGESEYPAMSQIKEWLKDLTDKSWYIDATDEAMKQMKNPIFGNIMLVGALAGTNVLPLTRSSFETIISQSVPANKVEINMKAFDMGMEMLN